MKLTEDAIEFSKNHKVLKRSDVKIMEKKYD